MADLEKVIKELHDARRYLEDKEWSDRGASPHIDAIINALSLLKEQEAVKPTWSRGRPFCGACGLRIHDGKFCSECGKPIAWEGR